MSCWTQVAGIIRVDNIGVLERKHSKTIKDILGVDVDNAPDIVSLGDYTAYAYDGTRIIPFGSEGSLVFSFWKNPDKSCMASDTISFFGSLRDFELTEQQELIQWFKDVVTELNDKCIGVRNAVMTADCEGYKQITVSFDNNPDLGNKPDMKDIRFDVDQIYNNYTPEIRCRGCAYLVEGDNGEWICDDCGKDIHDIVDEDCSAEQDF